MGEARYNWTATSLVGEKSETFKFFIFKKTYYCLLKLSSKLQMSLFHVVVWQRTPRNYSKVRTARAARLFVLIRPIKFFIYDVKAWLNQETLLRKHCCGNIAAETLLRIQMFPSLAAREACVAETNFATRKTKNVFPWTQKHFCFPKHMFPSLATPGNITRNIVSARMFPSLARP